MNKILIGILLGALLSVVYLEAGEEFRKHTEDSQLSTLMIRANIKGADIVKYLDLPRGKEFGAGKSVLVIERGEYGQPLKAYVQTVDTACVIETTVLFDLKAEK